MLFRYLANVFDRWHKRRALRRRARDAIEIPGIDSLFLSQHDGLDASRVVQAFQGCWQRVPGDVQGQLTAHWQRMRSRWLQRKTGLDLRIPIIGTFRSPGAVAAEYGFLIGNLFRAREWNGFADSGPSLMRLFASLYIVLPDLSDVPDRYHSVLLGRTIAGYYLSVQNKAEFTEFLGVANRGTELAESWGLSSDYDDWQEEQLLRG